MSSARLLLIRLKHTWACRSSSCCCLYLSDRLLPDMCTTYLGCVTVSHHIRFHLFPTIILSLVATPTQKRKTQSKPEVSLKSYSTALVATTQSALSLPTSPQERTQLLCKLSGSLIDWTSGLSVSRVARSRCSRRRCGSKVETALVANFWSELVGQTTSSSAYSSVTTVKTISLKLFLFLLLRSK